MKFIHPNPAQRKEPQNVSSHFRTTNNKDKTVNNDEFPRRQKRKTFNLQKE